MGGEVAFENFAIGGCAEDGDWGVAVKFEVEFFCFEEFFGGFGEFFALEFELDLVDGEFFYEGGEVSDFRDFAFAANFLEVLLCFFAEGGGFGGGGEGCVGGGMG